MADAEKRSKREESEEERKARKERERAERKAKEKAEGEKKPPKEETEEERKARKERAERKAREKSEGEKKPKKESEEERKARKERERAERKAKEKAEVEKPKAEETAEERKVRKEREHKAKEKAEDSKKPPKEETEDERKARKERERAERKAKEKAEKKRKSSNDEDGDEKTKSAAKESAEHHHHHSTDQPSDTTGNELLDALAEENRAAAREASKRNNEDSRESRRQQEEVQEQEATERRERRRAEREQRKKEKRKQRGEGQGSDGEDGEDGEDGTSAGIDTRSLQRQGYRAQFEKDMARATTLRRLVDLDDVSTVVVDAAPQSEYERYIRNFSSSGLQQVAVQCPPEENFISVEVQAERVRHKTRIAQVPDDLGLYPEQFAELNTFKVRGGDEDGDEADARNRSSNDDRTNTVNASGGGVGERKRDGMQPVDAAALGSFLNRVFPVMNALLDENSTHTQSSENAKNKAGTSFSNSYVSLTCSATLNRPVLSVRFSLTSDQYLSVLYGRTDGPGPSKDMDRYSSVVLVWNVYDTTAPERALVSYANVTCICLSPTRPHLVFGGTEDGCVCVWDLREPDRQHHTSGRFQRLVCRLPSYTTSWQSENHPGAVQQVCVAGYNSLLGSRKEDHEQLASVDETGSVHFWIVNDREHGRANAISDSDHGQSMFASVRLYPATTRNSRAARRGGADEDDMDHPADASGMANDTGAAAAAADALASSDGSSWQKSATDFDFGPADPSHYVVAMSDGVHNVSRYGSVAAPALYGPSTHFFDHPALVPSCVRYSTLDSRVLLVGYDDGTVRVFDDKAAYPQLAVTVGTQRITALCCSPHTRWMTWTLDQGSTVSLLDHARRNREVPVLSECVEKPDTGACLCMDVPRADHNERRRLALGFEKGMVQLHTLDPTKTLSSSADRDAGWM